MNLFVMLHYFDYALTFICSVGTITNRTMTITNRIDVRLLIVPPSQLYSSTDRTV